MEMLAEEKNFLEEFRNVGLTKGMDLYGLIADLIRRI
jgi:hypothetical protein